MIRLVHSEVNKLLEELWLLHWLHCFMRCMRVPPWRCPRRTVTCVISILSVINHLGLRRRANAACFEDRIHRRSERIRERSRYKTRSRQRIFRLCNTQNLNYAVLLENCIHHGQAGSCDDGAELGASPLHLHTELNQELQGKLSEEAYLLLLLISRDVHLELVTDFLDMEECIILVLLLEYRYGTENLVASEDFDVS
jgi:hypothetical protein